MVPTFPFFRKCRRGPGGHVTSVRASDLGTGQPGTVQPLAGSPGRRSVTPDASSRTSLKFVSWNAQSVLIKIAAVVQTVLDDEIDVLTLQEASLTADDTGRTKLNVPGYTTFFASARPGCGHEVAKLVKCSLPADVVDLGLAVGPNAGFIVLPHWDNIRSHLDIRYSIIFGSQMLQIEMHFSNPAFT